MSWENFKGSVNACLPVGIHFLSKVQILDLKFGQVELRRDISIVLRHEPQGKFSKRTMKAFLMYVTSHRAVEC